LMFRLTQGANSELARDALEELGKTRDSACLDQLFVWVLSPTLVEQFGHFEVGMALARLSSPDSDVYDRAAKLLQDAAPGLGEYRFFTLAKLMAIADERRAATDLWQLVADGNKPLLVRKAALSGLGRVCTRQSAEYLLDNVRDPELAESALWGIRDLLRWNHDYRYPPNRGLANRDWLLEELRKASTDGEVAEEAKKSIREWFGHAFPRLESLDLADLRQRLLDPQDEIYHGWPDGKTAEMLRQAREECNPRIVPILVEVLEKFPDASGNQAYQFQETLAFYANICPRAMRKELEARNLVDRLAAIPSYKRSFKVRDAMEKASVWEPRQFPSDGDQQRCYRLAQEVREGKATEAELLAVMDQLVARWQTSGFTYQALGALIKAGTPAARERFFKYVEEAKKPQINTFTQEPMESLELVWLLHHLYPENAADYFSEVLELLRSKSLIERKTGVQSLMYTLRWDFDFDAEALEAQRSVHLAQIEPLLRRLQARTADEARAILLAEAGTSLDGKMGEELLKFLVDAASSESEAAVPQALSLIESILGEKRCVEFVRFPRNQRARALRAYLRDAGKLPPD
jgi:hypothetical protein